MTWSYAVYGIWFFAWVVLELLGVTHKKGKIPWTTLSTTARTLESKFPLLRVVFAGGLFILILHITSVLPWPS